MCRTTLNALAATCTLVIVNGCKVVLYVNSIKFTCLLTLHTSDTTNLTLFTCSCALVLILTEYNRVCFVKRNKVDD